MGDFALEQRSMQSSVDDNNPRLNFDLEDETGDLDFLRGLYPGLTNDRLLEVKERLDGYFDIALEAFLEKTKQSSVDDLQQSS
jgi:hypothetical protein